ncbi:PD-(D/E)XK motif protein [Mesorhizobium sp. B2-8-9]|uniref:PD-(D/E)XK motif protein n=1 Tax=Mesorhizobium sp. B2-8-9 TaxID=2589899 RepID=UPI00112757E2|nr:PD-(D/E)XK motif protein [Mesorhizobium sp. B2-8-9]TPI78521.1 PD-(D/E)XK motif protein [Mesorhizobium sp. B2-8-9]
MSELHFEALRADLAALTVPQGQARNLRWLAMTLAIGRTATGDYEVFIRGPDLKAGSSLVRRHVQYGDWRPEEGGAPFSASRIVLPSAPHFASIAVLIAIELLRAGIAGPAGVQPAFTDVEPIIEMAIRRGALSETVVLGLVGELTVLRQLILARSDRPASMMRCLDFWQGWQEGGRDFRIGDHAIEVKTTQMGASIHEFSGLHQLEPKSLPSGSKEHLHLMSIGLAASTTMGETLPSLVSSIVALLSTAVGGAEVADEFVRRVSQYGTLSGTGYVHATMLDWSVYGTRFAHTFLPRLYRVDDSAMRLLGREKLAETFVQAHGLSFTMHIPDQVSAFNPAPNWEAELEAMDSI